MRCGIRLLLNFFRRERIGRVIARLQVRVVDDDGVLEVFLHGFHGT
jgi:hypothetical protein